MLYILYGDDPSRMDYKLETIKTRHKPDELIRIDAAKEGAAEVFNALDSMSLFALSPMVILEHANFLGAKNDTGIDPKDIDARSFEDKTVVMMLEAKKPDSRKKAVKSLMAKATLMECRALDENSQPAEIRQMMKERHMDMDRDAFEWFCRSAGYSSAQLAMQLDKLSLYSDHLSRQDVQALTTVEPTHNIFEMTDALFEKDAVRLLGLYRTFRAQNMEPQQILALLASQIRFVFQVKTLSQAGYTQQQLMETLQASSGRIWNSQKNARRFSSMQLLENLALLSRLDQNIKSGQIDKDTGFENFILTLGR